MIYAYLYLYTSNLVKTSILCSITFSKILEFGITCYILSYLIGSGQNYICKDKIPGCKSYTEQSDACESNYEFLNAYCQQACGFCGESYPILTLFCRHKIMFIPEIYIISSQ